MKLSLRLRLLLLAIVPLLLVGPSLLPGKRFLPLLPVVMEPLAGENPELAERALEGANLVASDRLFPVLTDELEIREQLLAGELPTWNPKLGTGLPLAAGSMAAPWNPLRWPFLLMPPEIAGGWHALLALFLAGVGMLLFLERRGLAVTAALFGAIAYQVGGFGAANLHYVMKVDAALWLPWCLWAVDGLFAERRSAPPVLCFALGASALAGFPPIFVFVLVTTAAWFVVRAATDERRGEVAWRRAVGKGLSFGALGILAGGVHLLPMLEASGASTRGPRAAEAVADQALPPAALLTAVLPDLYGDLREPRPASTDPAVWWLTSAVDRDRAMNANRLEWSLFAGVSVAALALAALFAATRRALFPTLGLVLVTVFIAGDPFARILYALPGLDLGNPARAGALWWFFFPWLGAIGLDALLRGKLLARFGAGSACAAGLALGATLWFSIDPELWAERLDAALVARHGVDLEAIRAVFSHESAVAVAERIVVVARTLMLFTGAGLLLVLFVHVLPERLRGIGWIALIAAEGLLFALPNVTPATLEGAPLFPDSPTLEAIAEAAGDGRVLRLDRSESGVEEVLQLARPNLLAAYGIADLTPYVVFPPKPLVELFSALDPASRYRGGISRLSDPERLDHPILDRLRVSCILSVAPIDHPRLELRHQREGFFVYHRSGVLPPARVVTRLTHGDAEELVRTPPPAAEAALCVRAELAEDLTPVGGAPPAEVRVIRPGPARIDFQINEAPEGWLVVHDSWASGWKATVNGKDAAVLRLDHNFCGVRVPAGLVVVRMKYEPWSLRFGAAASLLALCAAAFFTWRDRAARRRSTRGLIGSDAPAGPR